MSTGVAPTRRRGRKQDPLAICGAQRPRGGLCRRPPGLGTDHPGVGRCSQHGGNDKAAMKEALTLASISTGADSILFDGPVMGNPISMEPADALTWCVSIAAGEVAYLTHRIHQLDHEDVIGRPRTSKREAGEGEKGHKDIKSVELGPDALNILIAERQRAVDRLARLSKMALDAGVAERQVQLAERQGDVLVAAIEGVMEAIGLTPKQLTKLEAALPQVLLQMESGQQVMS